MHEDEQVEKMRASKPVPSRGTLPHLLSSLDLLHLVLRDGVALGRLNHRRLVSAFSVWRASTRVGTSQARRKLLAQALIRRMAERAVGRTMAAWHEVMIHRRKEVRALRFWLRRAQMKAYNCLKTFRAERTSKTRMLAFALARLSHRKLAAAFDAWRGSSDEQEAWETKMATAIGIRIVARRVSSTVAVWHAVTVLRRRQARAVKHWQHGELMARFNAWVAIPRENSRHFRTQMLAAYFIARPLRVKNVCSMMVTWHEVLEMRRKDARALRFWIQKAQKKALSAWWHSRGCASTHPRRRPAHASTHTLLTSLIFFVDCPVLAGLKSGILLKSMVHKCQHQMLL